MLFPLKTNYWITDKSLFTCKQFERVFKYQDDCESSIFRYEYLIDAKITDECLYLLNNLEMYQLTINVKNDILNVHKINEYLWI